MYAFLLLGLLGASAPDECPAAKGEWGFRPREGEKCRVNPPSFVVRLQARADRYEFVVARDPRFRKVVYRGQSALPAHCPPRILPSGRFWWRFRVRRKGTWSNWGKTRSFLLPPEAVGFPMPSRIELLRRIPGEHPRLFVRPDDEDRLREFSAGAGRTVWERLVRQAEEIVLNPPSTQEPPRYPPGTVCFSAEWRKLRKANRDRTVAVLKGAATLGFVGFVSADERYMVEGRKLLLGAARWNPLGSTGYRYNDEAGVAYARYFSRAYTFLCDSLTESERDLCRRVIRTRGRQMYLHLCPQHLWRPYRNLAGRAWFVLGEMGIAFFREIPEAIDWIDFALHVFYDCYPVWAGGDGGWHQGLAAFREEMRDFTDWADIVQCALRIDAYKKAFLAEAGYFPFYLQVPGSTGGGFGEGSAELTSRGNVPFLSVLARKKKNPYWQWYVDSLGGSRFEDGYLAFLRSALRPVDGKNPTDLPTSRVFRGIGVACLNSTLIEAGKNVAVFFKSSPFGSVGLGYEAQNSFLFYAFGKPFLIQGGCDDTVSLKFRREWLWRTKSVNTLTMEEISQAPHAWEAEGRITDFADSRKVSYVSGEAAAAYPGGTVKKFTRHLILLKGKGVVIWDEVDLETARKVTFHLHSPAPFGKDREWGAGSYQIVQGTKRCRIDFLWTDPFTVRVADNFGLKPPEGCTHKQWHLKAETEKRGEHFDLVTLIVAEELEAPSPPRRPPSLKEVEGELVLTLPFEEIWTVSMRPRSRRAGPGGGTEKKVVVRVEDPRTRKSTILLSGNE